MNAPTKVLLIALDAAEKDLILPWAAAGLLPAMRALQARSRSGVTLAPLGMHGGAIWQSLVTAVNPARHGHCAERQIWPGTYELRRQRPSDMRQEAFWSVLSRAGRRLAIIDPPYSPLCKDINGLHILDWTPHGADTGFCTAPSSLAGEVRTRFGRDEVGLCDELQLRSTAEVDGFCRALVTRVQQKTALARHYLAQDGWDLFMVAFGECHCVGHQCWHVHDAGHPLHDPAITRTIGDPLLAVYRALDTAIAELLDAAGSDATLLVVCTHGMGPHYLGAHLLGDILHRLGYGPPEPESSRAWAAARHLWRSLPADTRERLAPLQKATVDRVWPPLDGRYTCFAVPNGEVYGAIRVNLAGREPQGRVAPGASFDALCAEITHGLQAMVSVDTGRPFVGRVLRTAELYRGPYLDHLPDLLIEWNADAPLTTVHSDKTGTIRRDLPTRRTGHHRREGMFFATGPDIHTGVLPEPVSVMDLAPTVAAILNIPLPNVDGRPIADCVPTR